MWIGAAILTALGLLGMLLAWPEPATAQTVNCPLLSSGTRFKVAGHSGIYIITSDYKRLYFPHESVYWTWYDDFSGVVTIPNICYDNYPNPNNLPHSVVYRPGSYLIKGSMTPSVYAVEPEGKIRKIGNEAVAAALYGSNWGSKVRVVPEVFLPNYTIVTPPIEDAVPHNGMLIRRSGDANETVYYVRNGEKFRVVGIIPLKMWASVQIVASSVFNTVPTADTSLTVDDVRTNPAQR